MPIKLDAQDPDQPNDQPIVLSEIKKMTDKYRSDLKPNEAKSAWVSTAEVLKLIADNNGNGIRIYYGRHADNDPTYPGKHNMILVATRDSVHPEKPTSENSKDLLNQYAESGLVNSIIANLPIKVLDTDGDYTGDGDDAIPLCPPHCPIDNSALS